MLLGRRELIVVDDGSTDCSGQILDEARGAGRALHVIHHPRSLGYGAARTTGIRKAADADMVVGARTAEDAKHSPLRMIPKAMLRRYASLRGMEYAAFLVAHTRLGAPYAAAIVAIQLASSLAKFFFYRGAVFTSPAYAPPR